MQVLAVGKWSKAYKRWQMIVAMRRPRQDDQKPAGPGKRTDRPKGKC